jgi:hypothetical protein
MAVQCASIGTDHFRDAQSKIKRSRIRRLEKLAICISVLQREPPVISVCSWVARKLAA